MITLYYRTQSFLLMLDGVKVTPDSFTVSDYQRHSIFALPIGGNTKYLPVCGHIQTNAAGGINISNNFDYIAIRRGEFEIVPIFIEYSTPTTPTVIMQERYQDILATVYRDYSLQFIVEDGDTFYSHRLPHSVDTIKFYDSGNGTIIYATGNNYLLITIRQNGDFHMLVERHDCTVDFDGYNLRVSTKFCDTMLRELVECYVFGGVGFDLVSREFKHNLQHKYIPELLPSLLLDALMVGDHTFAAGILAPDLSQNIPALAGFFGEVMCYYNNAALPQLDNCIRLIIAENGLKSLKTFRFVCNNHHITDISLVD